jgi:uncharacterized membrane protein YebE (DUF533 family)
VQRSSNPSSKRAAEIYHAQASYVLRDANVSPREIAFLHALRAQLGLSSREAQHIEERVEALLRVDAPQTGRSGRSIRRGA